MLELRRCAMAEAEIIPFGSRGPRRGAGRAGPEASPKRNQLLVTGVSSPRKCLRPQRLALC